MCDYCESEKDIRVDYGDEILYCPHCGHSLYERCRLCKYVKSGLCIIDESSVTEKNWCRLWEGRDEI